MTLVTSSRKPAPELRTFGKDLAFSLGSKYIARGKAGLYEILAQDRIVIIVNKQRMQYGIDLYVESDKVAGCRFSSFSVERRTGTLAKGLRTGNQTVYESLRRYLDVLSTDQDKSVMMFDGTQRRRYILHLST